MADFRIGYETTVKLSFHHDIEAASLSEAMDKAKMELNEANFYGHIPWEKSPSDFASMTVEGSVLCDIEEGDDQ